MSLVSLFCCCCFPADENTADDERQPLLHPDPSGSNQPESARRTRPAAHSDTQTASRSGRLVMRLVCVSELDHRFSDMAETFNEQQGRYESMVRHITNLRQLYGCHRDNTLSLTECVRNMREEHQSSHRVTLQLKGYDFCLNVVPLESASEREEEPLPHLLKLAQDELKGASQDAKMTISVGTKLQELIGWLLRSEERTAAQVKEAAKTHQDQQRLDGNLQENLREVRRAKELSLEYKQRAGNVLTEVAQITGASL